MTFLMIWFLARRRERKIFCQSTRFVVSWEPAHEIGSWAAQVGSRQAGRSPFYGLLAAKLAPAHFMGQAANEIG
jgi:hypothetical protein